MWKKPNSELEDLESALRDTPLTAEAVEDMIRDLKAQKRKRMAIRVGIVAAAVASLLVSFYVGTLTERKAGAPRMLNAPSSASTETVVPPEVPSVPVVPSQGESPSPAEQTATSPESTAAGNAASPVTGVEAVPEAVPEPVVPDDPLKQDEVMAPAPTARTASPDSMKPATSVQGRKGASDTTALPKPPPSADSRPDIDKAAAASKKDAMVARSAVPVTVEALGIVNHLDLAARVDRLLKAGYSARIQEVRDVEGRDYLRLWIGRFEESSKAEAFAGRFRAKERMDASVVPATSRVSVRPSFAVEVVGGSGGPNGRKIAESLKRLGYSATLQPVPASKGKIRDQVWVGHFKDREAAEAFARQLYRNEGMRGIVVRRPVVVEANPSYTSEWVSRTEAEAKSVAARLKEQGIEAVAVGVRRLDGSQAHVVWAGSAPIVEEAEKLVARMSAAGLPGAAVRIWR